MKKLAVAILAVVPVALANAASFDCSKAKSMVEHLICDNPEISKLDEDLAANFKSALRDHAGAHAIREAQKQWLMERNGCPDTACVKTAYEGRLRTLREYVTKPVSRPASLKDICEDPIDSNLQRCLESGNYGLKNTYESLINNSDEHERAALRNEEQEWVTQRNQQCHLVADKDYFAGEDLVWSPVGDTEKVRLTKVRCVLNLTRERIAKLEPQSESKKAISAKLAAKYESMKSSDYEPPFIPSEGAKILDFVPRGYAILEKVEADFNGDKRNDVAMILGTVPLVDPYPRPFLVLFAKPSGGYSLSARNDHVAPTGEGGGIANPHGVDALASKGRSVLIEEFGGGSSRYSLYIQEFGYLKSEWYLIATEELSGYRDGSLIERQPDGWGVDQTGTRTDLITGRVTNLEYWSNANTSEKRIKERRGSDITPQELKKLGEIR